MEKHRLVPVAPFGEDSADVVFAHFLDQTYPDVPGDARNGLKNHRQHRKHRVLPGPPSRRWKQLKRHGEEDDHQQGDDVGRDADAQHGNEHGGAVDPRISVQRRPDAHGNADQEGQEHWGEGQDERPREGSCHHLLDGGIRVAERRPEVQRDRVSQIDENLLPHGRILPVALLPQHERLAFLLELTQPAARYLLVHQPFDIEKIAWRGVHQIERDDENRNQTRDDLTDAAKNEHHHNDSPTRDCVRLRRYRQMPIEPREGIPLNVRVVGRTPKRTQSPTERLAVFGPLPACAEPCSAGRSSMLIHFRYMGLAHQ